MVILSRAFHPKTVAYDPTFHESDFIKTVTDIFITAVLISNTMQTHCTRVLITHTIIIITRCQNWMPPHAYNQIPNTVNQFYQLN